MSAQEDFKKYSQKVFNNFEAICIGAGNSKVIQLKSGNGEEPCILKLAPSTENTKVVKTFKEKYQGDLFLDSDVDVSVEIEGITFNLVLTDNAGQDFETYFNTQRSNNLFSDSEDFLYFSKMAEVFKILGDSGILFSDGKSTNMRIKDGHIFLADTSSFVKIGTTLEPDQRISTLHVCPPEFLNGTMKFTSDGAEKMHVYELGINMIELFSEGYVEAATKKPTEVMKDYLYVEFKASRDELLGMIKDADLKVLLQACVADDPESRPTLEEVIHQLQLIENTHFLITSWGNQDMQGLKEKLCVSLLEACVNVFDENLFNMMKTNFPEVNKLTAKLHQLNDAPHLKEFYAIIGELNKKCGVPGFQSAGREKARAVMEEFVKLSIDQRLNPHSSAWNNVMTALEVKRGLFESTSYKRFKDSLKKAKDTQASDEISSSFGPQGLKK